MCACGLRWFLPHFFRQYGAVSSTTEIKVVKPKNRVGQLHVSFCEPALSGVRFSRGSFLRALLRTQEEKLKQRLLTDYDLRARWARWGSWVNRVGMRLERLSRKLVRFMNHHLTDIKADWFVVGKVDLHNRIAAVLERQKSEYGSLAYFYGYPYQSLGILSIYGERSTEERFDDYGIRDLIGPEDRLLDIGCNCGFMALYTSFRTGCRAEGIDINPYMIEIGDLAADYLNISDKVKLSAIRIQDFAPTEKYTVVFSFATHWTDDENYRVPIREHFERLGAYLERGGLLVFETHAADVGDQSFYNAMAQIGDIFEELSRKDTDAGGRHLYLLRRV